MHDQVHSDHALRDADKINATTMLGAGGVVSTARNVSAFKRALRPGGLLLESLNRLLADPPPGMPPQQPSGGPCAGNPEFAPGGGGSAPASSPRPIPPLMAVYSSPCP
ncbi:hypothetical protein [Microtetraspora malaysiensis]|uniref:hypothetical protein n=1 Tax=Microtetraspora malaysiensis TaxID=161358 RepID=UPI00082E1B40|nr:hypothetical protein [Microtetraspora malaysiensis]